MAQGLPRVRLLLGLVISVAAFGLVVMRVDFNEVADAFRIANYKWLLVAAVCSSLTVPIRAERWRLLCSPTQIAFPRALGILSVGAALTALLPLRLGDVVRAYLVGEMERRSKVWALATMVVERMFDIVALLVITVVLLPFVSLPDWAADSARVTVGLALVGLVAIFGIWFSRSIVERRAGSLSGRFSGRPIEHVRAMVRHVIDGLSILSQPAQLIGAVFWTATLWLVTSVVIWATLMAFNVTTSPTIALLLVLVSAATVAVPLSPSAVGVYHAAIVETLIVVTTVSSSTAASVAIVAHALLFVPPIVFGFACFWLVPGIAERLLLMRRTRKEPAGAQMVSSGPLPPG